MTNDTTTLNGALSELGETMASNLVSAGITDASANDGLTTLANKINNIKTISNIGDCYLFDKAIQNNNMISTNWFNYRNYLTVTTDVNGTILTGNASQTGYFIVGPYGNSSAVTADYNYFDTWCMEFDILDYYDKANYRIGLYFRQANSSEQSTNFTHTSIGMPSNFTGHVKFWYDGENFYSQLNGDTIKSREIANDGTLNRVGFKLAKADDIYLKFKNFIIYPITVTN